MNASEGTPNKMKSEITPRRLNSAMYTPRVGRTIPATPTTPNNLKFPITPLSKLIKPSKPFSKMKSSPLKQTDQRSNQ